MCLIVFSYRQHPGYRLVLAANRDEFLDRPTAALGYHFPGEAILAGRDLRSGGTWLGLTADGRLAAITNYRDPARVRSAAPSRGAIILNYLRSSLTPDEFVRGLAVEADTYNGFNLLLGDGRNLIHYANVSGRMTVLEPGIHGLSNHLLDTPWPKVVRAGDLLRETLAATDVPDHEAIFTLLTDREEPDEKLLPETGVSPAWERLLSPIFIHGPTYGTRSSSILAISDDGRVEFHERTYRHDAHGVSRDGDRGFRFTLSGSG